MECVYTDIEVILCSFCWVYRRVKHYRSIIFEGFMGSVFLFIFWYPVSSDLMICRFFYSFNTDVVLT